MWACLVVSGMENTKKEARSFSCYRITRTQNYSDFREKTTILWFPENSHADVCVRGGQAIHAHRREVSVNPHR